MTYYIEYQDATIEIGRFDKSYNNRAHPPHGVALQNVLNNGEEANSP